MKGTISQKQQQKKIKEETKTASKVDSYLRSNNWYLQMVKAGMEKMTERITRLQ